MGVRRALASAFLRFFLLQTFRHQAALLLTFERRWGTLSFACHVIPCCLSLLLRPRIIPHARVGLVEGEAPEFALPEEAY